MTLPLYVDVTPLLGRQLTGVGRYAARLVDSLARRVPVRLFTGVNYADLYRVGGKPSLYEGVEIAITPADVPDSKGIEVHKWRNAVMDLPNSRFDSGRAAECVGLFTFLRAPSRFFRRELGIVFDFTPVLLPHTHLRSVCDSFATYCTEHIRLCDKIIAISEATGWDAQWLCDFPPRDIVVAYPGPSQCISHHAYTRGVRRRPGLLLVVSTLEPRKNGNFLLEWFQNSPVIRDGSELWWVGPPGWLASPREWLKNGRSGRKVRFMGMTSDKNLCRLFQQAECTIYPSLYEGFGFPVLDSLLHRTPVLCSYNSSLREFDGPGVYYFDALDQCSLNDAYVELHSSPLQTIVRRDLHQRCSWDALADVILSHAA